MQNHRPRRWLIGAVPFLVGLLLIANPAPARAQWMGDAFNQSLIQAINQVMDLVVMAAQQDQRVPHVNQALHQLMRALVQQGHGHKQHQGHHGKGEGGFAGGFAPFAGMGGGMGFFPPVSNVGGGQGGFANGGGPGHGRAGNGGGHQAHDRQDHPAKNGGFGAGMRQVGGEGARQRQGGDNIRVNGHHNIVIAGNQGNIVINGNGNAHLNANEQRGGAFGVGMNQAACNGNRGGRDVNQRQPQAPLGDVVAGKVPIGNQVGQRKPGDVGGARGPMPPPNANLGNPQNGKPIGALAGNRKPAGAAPGPILKPANQGAGNKPVAQVAAAPGGKVGGRVNQPVQGGGKPNAIVAAPGGKAPAGGQLAGAPQGQRNNPAGANKPAAQPGGKVAGALVGQKPNPNNVVGNRAPAPVAGRQNAPRVGAPVGGRLAAGNRAGANVGQQAKAPAPAKAPVAAKNPPPKVSAPQGGNKAPVAPNLKNAPSRVSGPLPATNQRQVVPANQRQVAPVNQRQVAPVNQRPNGPAAAKGGARR